VKNALATALGVALFSLVFYEPLPLVTGWLFALLVLRALWLGQISWLLLLTRWVLTLVIAVTVPQATLGNAMIGFILP